MAKSIEKVSQSILQHLGYDNGYLRIVYTLYEHHVLNNANFPISSVSSTEQHASNVKLVVVPTVMCYTYYSFI